MTRIRMARAEDAGALLEIFRPYVLETAVSFSLRPPTVEEFRAGIEERLCRYPYLIAEDEGEIVGYAYASPFKSQSAYDWAVETSIYIRRELRGYGYGRMLHDALEALLKRQNILSMYACIACTDREDAHLTNDSVDFHAHLGYELTARFPRCGYKFDRWYDMVWMHREIGSHEEAPRPVIPASELDF